MQEELGAPPADAEPIRRFLAERFLFDPDASIDVRSSLLGEGILDSTGAMELVLFLEEQFGIEVADNELVPANLDSIERIASFVARKRVAVNAASEIVSKTTLTVEVSSKLKFEKAPSSSEALRAVTR
jgi:acyl carrier protein